MDAKDAEPRDAAWNRVSEQFAALGERLRSRYEESPLADEGSAQREGGVDRDSVQDALRTLGDAAERLAATVGGTVRDPEVQAEAKRAASSLVDALGITFSQVTEDIRRRRAGRSGEDPWDDPAPQPPVVEEIETRPEE